jgi:hypothetical protein
LPLNNKNPDPTNTALLSAFAGYTVGPNRSQVDPPLLKSRVRLLRLNKSARK